MFGGFSSSADKIKSCEDRLALNPDSLLFACLAQAYLDAGRVDDALRTARYGVARFPLFVAGQRALALACHARGLTAECRGALERVVEAVPEDVAAQKMLGRLLKETGDNAAARLAFATVLEFNPLDDECRNELAELDAGLHVPLAAATFAAGVTVLAGAAAGESREEEIIEDIEILDIDDSDLLEDEGIGDLAMPSVGAAPAEHEDPLSTATLAELYVQQGHIDKALEIYRSVAAESHAGRIAELEAMTASAAVAAEAQAFAPVMMSAARTDSALEAEPMLQSAPRVGSDAAVATMEEWLANIGRIRSCR